jgi:hypothetical protein
MTNHDGDQRLFDRKFAEIVSEPCDHDPLAPMCGITALIVLTAALIVWSIR